ncbi:coproporphyrinogen III oxidase [Spiroplasma sabaudiense Ar-1343]|uniref:Heme chaperone HemW n=1 Tax=Spiroplasma sabaudiense Ar-1343 TaxID=1276257 RepID=W6A9A7_9MOLU|nr:radical SAM family heme chaperone HemW [Spiroplasma sabaudiense]AHI53698.1 coproporphyrinogen III oxidase [Spiroplasma sabaudiense Ar-1343]
MTLTDDKLIELDIESLYVHIPFCDSICFFCDFVKVKKTSDSEVEDYLKKLENEISLNENYLSKIKTIYIGGGTPSCLNIECTIKMLEILKPFTTKVEEYTIEINPEKVNEEKLKIYLKYGINRLSIGIQTFNNSLLKKIGRIHDNTQAIKVIKMARVLGFKNISIDLIYNLYDQTHEDILTDISFIKDLQPDHISWYSLILKENSIWGKLKNNLPENDEYFDEVINRELAHLRYQRYEVSNYGLNKSVSKHNLSYWTNKQFIGVGVGAAGFLKTNKGPILTKNSGNVLSWNQSTEILSQEDYYLQIIMMGLRLVDGINFENVADGKAAFEFFKTDLEKHLDNGLLELTKTGLKCTKRGYEIMDAILVDLIK